MMTREAVFRLSDLDGVIFDLDGVVTDTAASHARAWQRTFDAFLEHVADPLPFDPDMDYRRWVDGKPRYEGVHDFLASRGIDLPWGDPADPPGFATICAIGNAKNAGFLETIRSEGVRAFTSTIALIERLRAEGVAVAVISSSRNCGEVLDAAGARSLFDAEVCGSDAEMLGLKGKPAPDVFIEAARRMDVDPSRAAVVEDALAGVAAAQAGGFALAVGVDRFGHPEALIAAGADVVVSDLAEMRVDGGTA